MSPRSSHLRKRRMWPAKCGRKVDGFGDVKYDFEYARDHDSDSSASSSSNLDSDGESESDDSSDESCEDTRFMGQKRLPIDDYEIFLYGFYYFFFLQDPMIN